MASLLFIIEPESFSGFHGGNEVPDRSSDEGLLQLAKVGLGMGHDVFFAAATNLSSDSHVVQVTSFAPLSVGSPHPASARRFAAVFSAHPETHDKWRFPGARTVAYCASLEFVKRPESLMRGEFYDLLRAVQYHIDFFIFANERQADFFNIFTRALAGIDITPMTVLLPVGSDASKVIGEQERTEARKFLRIGVDDLVLYAGASTLLRGDFERFLREYSEFAVSNPRATTRLILGPARAIPDSVRQLVREHGHLLAQKTKAAWKLLDATASTDDATVRRLYAATDIGICTARPGLQQYLAHSPDVVQHLGSGHAVLVNKADYFATLRKLEHLVHVVDHADTNAYQTVVSNLAGTVTKRNSPLLVAARNLLENSEAQRTGIASILSKPVSKTIKECPINWVRHQAKVDAVKIACRRVFRLAISDDVQAQLMRG